MHPRNQKKKTDHVHDHVHDHVNVYVNVHVDVDVDVDVDVIGSCHAKILSRRARSFGLKLVVRRNILAILGVFVSSW